MKNDDPDTIEQEEIPRDKDDDHDDEDDDDDGEEEEEEEAAAEDTQEAVEKETDTHHDEKENKDVDNEGDDDVIAETKKLTEDSSDPASLAQAELINKSTPTTELEIALYAALKRKDTQIHRLTGEITKLKAFVSKRKQTYKRKRKDEGAPTRALSAYNIFIQDRFARLAKENENALKSESIDAQMKRVPPANLVASTGNEWKELSGEIKAKYEERYVCLFGTPSTPQNLVEECRLSLYVSLYSNSAKEDRKRYEDEMAAYQPPDKQANRKRNKTGYNMFFSAHVLRLKQSEAGVPSERGSVARLVGTAWKQLTPDEKQYYEREADKHNGMHPVKDGDDDDEDEEVKRQQMEHYHMHAAAAAAHGEMHMHPMAQQMHAQHPQHDPRHHGYYAPHMYGQPPYGHYDYSQHHRHQQARAQGYNQGYPPQRHPYEG